MKGDIMEIAIATLGEVVYKIMTCDENKIKEEFKFYFIGMVYNRYFDLMKNDGAKIYARALINSVRQCEIIRECKVNRTSLQYKKILLKAADDNKLVDMAINGKVVTKLREILRDDIDKHEK